MRRRTKLRLAVLGGMIAGTLASAWLLDALEAVARWMLMNWFCWTRATPPRRPRP